MDEQPDTKVSILTLENNRVRLKYVLLFLGAMVFALLAKEFGYKIVGDLYSFRGCQFSEEEQVKACVGKQMIFRISFCLAAFFGVMLLLCYGAGDEGIQADIHNKYFKAKVFLLLAGVVGTMFVESDFFIFYAMVAVYLSALFLLMQLIYLIGWIGSIGQRWVEEDRIKLLTFSTIVMYVASIVSIVFLYSNFAGGDCSQNRLFIILNIFFGVAYSILAIFTDDGSIFEAALTFLYTWYTVGNGLMSFPDSECNPFVKDPTSITSILPGIIITILAITYSSFNLSSKSSFFNLNPPDDDDSNLAIDRSDSYSFTFFNLIYMLASVYMSMLLTGWDINQTSTSETIDSGEPAGWVKIIMSWVIALLYTWSLIAPSVLTDREF